MSNPLPFKSRILKQKLIAWRDLKFIQQEDFKELPLPAREKLKTSIIENQFSDPFKVWYCEEDGETYCLDGKHRTIILEELITDGVSVPDLLPATLLYCADKTEAAKLVLIYSSQYAHITPEGFQNFVSFYGLDEQELNLSIDIPGLKLPEITEVVGNFDEEGIGVKNQYGVIVMCEDETDQEQKFNELSDKGYNCKVVVT